MDFTAVTDPIRCPEAFRYEGSDAVQAQAACLLILGIYLRRDVEAMRARSDAMERLARHPRGGSPVVTSTTTLRRTFAQMFMMHRIDSHGPAAGATQRPVLGATGSIPGFSRSSLLNRQRS